MRGPQKRAASQVRNHSTQPGSPELASAPTGIAQTEVKRATTERDTTAAGQALVV